MSHFSENSDSEMPESHCNGEDTAITDNEETSKENDTKDEKKVKIVLTKAQRNYARDEQLTEVKPLTKRRAVSMIEKQIKILGIERPEDAKELSDEDDDDDDQQCYDRASFCAPDYMNRRVTEIINKRLKNLDDLPIHGARHLLPAEIEEKKNIRKRKLVGDLLEQSLGALVTLLEKTESVFDEFAELQQTTKIPRGKL